MLDMRTRWLTRNVSLALLLFLLWDTVIVKPLRVLVVLFHEIFHALAALVTGGGVRTIEVVSHRTGLTSLYGGIAGVVYSSGYVGTAFLGALLLGSSHRWPVKRSLYLGIGVLILANTLGFVRTPFGWAYGLVAGVFFITLFFKEFWFSTYITELVGLLCIVDVFYAITGFFLSYSRNDAAILSELSGLPYYLILSIWTVVAMALVSAAGYITWHNLTPEKLESRLQWGEFYFVTRRFVERSCGMTDLENNAEKRRGWSTIAVYISILVAVVLLTIWVSRYVLFQPWTAREWANATAAREEIYIFGGRDRHGRNYDEIYRVDLQDLRIHEIASLPSPRFGMATAAVGDRIYVFGGFDGRKCYDDILVLDAKRDRLTRLAHLPSSRCFGAVAVNSGQIYYLGGWDGAEQLDEILRIDPDSGDTKLIGKLPSPRELVAAESLDGKIYLFGGSDKRGDYLDDVLEIDPTTGSVVRMGHLPSGRTRTSAVSLDDRILLIGGWEGEKLNEVLSLKPDGEVLKTQLYSRLERGYSDVGTVHLDRRIYLVGGAHERFQRQIQVLRWDLESGKVDSIKFRSFLFW